MTGLSIVIPVLGNPNLLDDTLVSILENRPANCEIIVVHTEPYDDPYHLAGEVQFLKAERKAGLAECLNLGIAESRAPVVHVLACGVEVGAGWADAAMRHFRDKRVAAVAAVVCCRDDRQKVISAGLGYRMEGLAWRLGQGRSAVEVAQAQNVDELVGPDTLAAFYRKSALEAVGGFSPWDADLLVGTDMALALWHAGFRCVTEPKCIVRADAALASEKPGFRHGRDAERLFWRWLSKHGRMCSLAAHAAMVAGECILGLWRPLLMLRLAGRIWGLIRAMFAKRHSRRLQAESADEPAVIAAPMFVAAQLDRQRRRQGQPNLNYS